MYFSNCDVFMKSKPVLYQLLLERINRYSAIALSLSLAIASTPAIAQEETIELQDANPVESPQENLQETPRGNANDLPERDFRNLPGLPPQEAPVSSPTGANSAVDFATKETDYTLGAGDQITLNIFQVEEYSGNYPVLVDGTISLPLVGRVNVSGLTLKETSEKVSKKYSTYLKRPIITVGLVAPRPLKIGISGEVDNPGSYEVAIGADNPKFPTVTNMITKAGGINTIADVRKVRVTRKMGGKEMVFTSDLWALLTQGAINQDISLRDGDTIFVPTADSINTTELSRLAEASFGIQTDEPIKVAVVGEVFRPGSHTIQPEQLGRNNGTEKAESLPPRLSQALALAQGIKPLGNVRDIQVKRTAWDGTEKLIAVDMWQLLESGDANQDIILQEGDKIFIPEADAMAKEDLDKFASSTLARENITVNVVGEVVNPGAQTLKPNIPLNQAILAAGGFDNTRAAKGEVELVRLQPNGTVDKRKIQIDLASGIDEEVNPTLRHNDVVVVNRSGLTRTSDGLGQLFSPFGAMLNFFRIF